MSKITGCSIPEDGLTFCFECEHEDDPTSCAKYRVANDAVTREAAT